MSYALNLNDSEAITIEAALKGLLKLSQEEIASGGVRLTMLTSVILRKY
jgi:hypothetical protein